MAIDDLTLNTTGVCDLALSHIGMKPLVSDLTTDVSNNSPSAKAITKHWASCRNETLGDFKYPFATVIDLMTLNTSVDSDDYPEWTSFYTYPSSAVKVWYVFDSYNVATKHENQFEVVYNPTQDEKIICCECDTLNSAYVEYSYNVTDTTKWDPRFVTAFSYRLASAICKELTGSDDMALKMMEIYNRYIHETKRVAHIEKKKKPTQSNPILDARG